LGESEYEQWPETKSCILLSSMHIYYTHLVTFYEYDMLPFLVRIFHILCSYLTKEAGEVTHQNLRPLFHFKILRQSDFSNAALRHMSSQDQQP
jgi:hypothetical protein